jgi:hypothetical protein
MKPGYCKGCSKNVFLVQHQLYIIPERSHTGNLRVYWRCQWCGFENIKLRDLREDHPDVRGIIHRGGAPIRS